MSTSQPILHIPFDKLPSDVELTNVSVVPDAKFGACARFDGQSSRAVISTMRGTKAYTFAIWIKCSAHVDDYVTLIEFGDNAPYFGLYKGVPFFWGTKVDGLYGTSMKATSALPIGEWVHLVIVSPAPGGDPDCRMFINGNLVTRTWEVRVDGIGMGLGHHQGNRYFAGCMADVRIYDVALSPSEIKALATGSQPVDTTAFVYNAIVPGLLEHKDLSVASRQFYAEHGDDYDFLSFVVPRDLAQAVGRISAFHAPVRREACLQLGDKLPVRNGESMGSAARLKGLSWLPISSEGYGPPTMNHEQLHHWGVRLASKWSGFITNHGGHWGYASTNGSLGGFDLGSLCTRQGERILDPSAVSPGTEVRVDSFSPQASTIAKPYSAIELYLMGLIDKSEVPGSIYIMRNPVDMESEGSIALSSQYDYYRVDGFDRVPLTELIALNQGEPPRATQTAFRTAFIALTTSPATPAQLETAAYYARLFGRLEEDQPSGGRMKYLSFEEATGGRMKADVRLT